MLFVVVWKELKSGQSIFLLLLLFLVAVFFVMVRKIDYVKKKATEFIHILAVAVVVVDCPLGVFVLYICSLQRQEHHTNYSLSLFFHTHTHRSPSALAPLLPASTAHRSSKRRHSRGLT